MTPLQHGTIMSPLLSFILSSKSSLFDQKKKAKYAEMNVSVMFEISDLYSQLDLLPAQCSLW